jgi:hypothetical protein
MYSNGIWIPDKLVQFSNGQLVLPVYCGLKTSLVFEWLKTRWRILPFENWTQIVSGKWPLEYWTVRFSNGDCTHFSKLVLISGPLLFEGKINISKIWTVSQGQHYHFRTFSRNFWDSIVSWRKFMGKST